MRTIRALLIASVIGMLWASPATAAKPAMERITIDDHVVDEFLSDACGFEVRVDVVGHIIFRAFLDDAGEPVRELNNFGIRLQFSSDWASLQTVDVGVDRVRFNADGSILQVIIGNVQSIQLPGEGRVYSDVGQITLLVTFPDPEGPPEVELVGSAGQHPEVDQIAVICEALAG